MGMLMLETRRG